MSLDSALSVAAANPAPGVPDRTRAADTFLAPHPLRIAVFSYGLPCPGQKRGGIEQVAHDLANAWVDRGHQVTLFTCDPPPKTARYDTEALPGARFVRSWLGRRVTMGYLGNVLSLLPGYRDFDVVVAHGDSLLMPLLGKPVVRVMHGSAREEARSATSPARAVLQYGVYLQELLTARLCGGTVAISENTRASNRFITRVIPNGIDRALFRPDAGVRTGQPSILFVGALGGRKRGSWLLDQFRTKIRAMVPHAELHMVTTPGPSEPGVHYHTGVEESALVRLYQSAWVYASPSTYEGFGLPYVEALACGTPVVATPNPGSREVLADGAFGVLAADDEFASSVCRLLEDGDLRAGMARAGVRRAADFDLTGTAAVYETLMNSLVVSRA
jgi:glycosyltransferase involved in cell wall biosynthesis